jgi:hypothetical protein
MLLQSLVLPVWLSTTVLVARILEYVGEGCVVVWAGGVGFPMSTWTHIRAHPHTPRALLTPHSLSPPSLSLTLSPPLPLPPLSLFPLRSRAYKNKAWVARSKGWS